MISLLKSIGDRSGTNYYKVVRTVHDLIGGVIPVEYDVVWDIQIVETQKNQSTKETGLFETYVYSHNCRIM